MKFRKELVGSTTAALIMAVLNRRPAHGYAIVASVSEESRGVFQWREGTVYPALARLERQGLIAGAWEQGEGSKRRKVYSLTPAGKRELSRRRREWSVFSATVSGIMEACHA